MFLWLLIRDNQVESVVNKLYNSPALPAGTLYCRDRFIHTGTKQTSDTVIGWHANQSCAWRRLRLDIGIHVQETRNSIAIEIIFLLGKLAIVINFLPSIGRVAALACHSFSHLWVVNKKKVKCDIWIGHPGPPWMTRQFLVLSLIHGRLSADETGL